MMENIPYDVEQLGPDPAKKPEDLFKMLGRGEVAGVFQVEGAGMRRLMMKMKPSRFDHIIAAISLYRPGPMDNIPEYIERMHGRKQVSYHHPDLEAILQDTYGILVYQEQIIRIAAELAGYAPGEADMIRKAVAKKKRDLMDKHQDQFTAGAMSRGYSEETCQAIWGDIEFFARYGFNKAHAADYAVITCQTAFLKAHYPVEYMAALLSVERNNSEKVAHYLAEARRMEISVAPSHINRADLDFSIEDNEEQPVIRYGLGAIKNVSTPGLIQILDERSANGPYEGLSDLSERVDLRSIGKRTLEAMIKVGTFDAWGSRPQLLDGLDRIIGYSSKTHEAAAAGQMSLFHTVAGTDLDMEIQFLRPETELPTLDQREVLSWEKELIGAYISEHPLTAYMKRLQDVATTSTAELDSTFNGRKVTTVGLLTYLRKHVTKKGDSMAFGTLEDLHGTVELVFFPSIWKEVHSDVNLDQVYLIRGNVSVDSGDRAKIIVNSIDHKLIVARETEDKNREFANATVSEYSPNVKESLVSDPKIAYDPDSPIAGRQVNNEVLESIPAPPPNFEDDQFDWDSTQNNPPDELTPSNGQIQTRTKNDVTKEQVESRNPGYDGDLQLAARIVVVDLPPDAGWQEKCLELVQVAEKYEGDDSLRICVEGQGLMMDFPNQKTQYCPELVKDMDRLQIKVHVEEV
jgi:DNA polymerase-3 subunit alpha